MGHEDEQDPTKRIDQIGLKDYGDRAYRLLDGLARELTPSEGLPGLLRVLNESEEDQYIAFHDGVGRELVIQEILKLDPNLEGPLREAVIILPNKLSLFPLQRLAKQRLEDLGFMAAKFATDKINVFPPARLGMMAVGQILIQELPPTPFFEDEQGTNELPKVYDVESLDDFVSYLVDLWTKKKEIEKISDDSLRYQKPHFRLASTEQTLSAYTTGVAMAFLYLGDRTRAQQVIEIFPQKNPLREALSSALS